MNEQFYQEIKNALDHLQQIAEVEKGQKLTQIIDIFEKFPGNKHVAEKLRKNGLPNGIFISADIPPDIAILLSRFAPISRVTILSAGTIFFSWMGEVNPMNNGFQFKPYKQI
jgi:hypothetical protein